MNNKIPDGKFMSAVKVGPKGQIVIPKEVRDMFGIDVGTTLLLLADVNRGIAINRMDAFSDVFEKAMPQAETADGNESVTDDPSAFKEQLDRIKEEIGE